MPNNLGLSRYPIGAVVRRPNGTEFIKSEDGLKPLARHVASMSDKVFNGGHKLDDNERVYHLDNTLIGTKEYNEPKNLVVVRQNREKVHFIKSKITKVLFLPTPERKILLREPMRIGVPPR